MLLSPRRAARPPSAPASLRAGSVHDSTPLSCAQVASVGTDTAPHCATRMRSRHIVQRSPQLRLLDGGALLRHAVTLALLCAAPLAAPSTGADAAEHGWGRGQDSSIAGPCTVERRAWREVTQAKFDAVYLEAQPVVLTGLPENTRIRELCARERLLADWGEHTIVLGTANTYSYDKVRTTLREYVTQHMAPQDEARSGKDSLYHFGDNNRSEWAPLMSTYVQPPFIPATAAVALSFGLAGPGSGVPFHIHGAGYSETIVGRKRWLLYPPARRPPFDPNESTLAWLRRWQAGGATELAMHGEPLDCTLHPGEAIYFPTGWWHATLNVDEAVFMSTFVSYAPPPASLLPRRAGVAAPLPVRTTRDEERELRR